VWTYVRQLHKEEEDMTTPVDLVNGLGGAIGCDYRSRPDQLDFVEFNGKVSRLNMIRPLISIVSQGTTILKGTWIFDCETGSLGGPMTGPGDIWWEQIDAVKRQMAAVGGAKIVNLGVVDFNSISPADLQKLAYGSQPVIGNIGADNKLVNGDVFAVLTNAGNFTKIKVVMYDYNMTIQWATYKVGPRYQVLGVGYSQPEDIAVFSDERYALVTERSGNLLRVDLTNANRPAAIMVSAGMQAPQQIALDEAHNQAYIVEYANPGRLIRINLANGAQTVLLNTLENPIGLLVTKDLRYAYISEQTAGPDKGRITRIDLNTRTKYVLAKGLVNPFFLTWADKNENGFFVPERDPSNRILFVNLTIDPCVVTPVESGVPFRPSSVALMGDAQMLISSDQIIQQRDLTQGLFSSGAPMLMGIGHVPKTAISADGYATTDPGYFFQVKDSPFGGTLAIMINHGKGRNLGANHYQILVDGVPQSVPWSDYKWNDALKKFELVQNPQTGAYFLLRTATETWYNHWLGYFLDTSALSEGQHMISVKIFAALNQEIPAGADAVNVRIDNKWPLVSIKSIWHDNAQVKVCDIVKSGSTTFQFEIEAWDLQEHLLSWSLVAVWGDNKSTSVSSDTYANHVIPSRKWAGIAGKVPAAAWDANVAGDPSSRHCAHTFYLDAWDRVINGWNYIHYASAHASITIDIP